MTYTESDLLRLAKRFHNTKRTYLLVNPLQGKHLAVSPSKATAMFHALGKKVRETCGDAGLIIGFAETATALGMGVAEEMPESCVYVHTTRERVPEEEHWIEFCEEHSHAVDQKLSASHISEWLKNTQVVVFVDDEISTGKTLINFVTRLREVYPEIENKRLVAASLINRVSDENRLKMERCGIEGVSLLKMDELDYAEAVRRFTIEEAKEPVECVEALSLNEIISKVQLMNPRLGVSVSEYVNNVRAFADLVAAEIHHSGHTKSILVLGTEECMYPAIVLGEKLEEKYKYNVYTHATTRSPIGICTDEGYPVQSGCRLKSLYDRERITYIYNLRKYDQVIVVTDSKDCSSDSSETLKRALAQSGNDNILLIRG
uniref:phosphoribosyltransferase domain-containing protein n=1 Tax=Eubacterium cellulosolvens TaxID=29322 RepID=UPI0004833639|nr:phosphoribosyltransferase domain-containing protein [[Eubacterium] cellulosolvens]